MAVTIIFPRLLAYTVADSRMGRMVVTLTLPFVGLEQRAASRDVSGDELIAGPPVCVVAASKALLTGIARQHTDNGGLSLA